MPVQTPDMCKMVEVLLLAGFAIYMVCCRPPCLDLMVKVINAGALGAIQYELVAHTPRAISIEPRQLNAFQNWLFSCSFFAAVASLHSGLENLSHKLYCMARNVPRHG